MTTRGRRALARLAATVLVIVAAPALALTAGVGPASAATCSTASGVSVVVDFGALGGGVQAACVSGRGGQAASSLFPAAGFTLTPVQNQQGFVCRVSGKPLEADEACVNTPPGDAYWGLWWSDGTSGSWSYSNYGVGGLKVPDGGYVAFAWKQGSGQASPPGVVPAAHAAPTTPTAAPSSAASSTPTPKPTKGPTKNPSKNPSSGPTKEPTKTPAAGPTRAPSAPSSAAPSEPTATDTASATPSASPSVSATPTPTAVAAESAAPVDPSSGVPTAGSELPAPSASADDPVAARTTAVESSALPAWVVPLVIVVLAGIAGAAFVVRRRARPSP